MELCEGFMGVSIGCWPQLQVSVCSFFVSAPAVHASVCMDQWPLKIIVWAVVECVAFCTPVCLCCLCVLQLSHEEGVVIKNQMGGQKLPL